MSSHISLFLSSGRVFAGARGGGGGVQAAVSPDRPQGVHRVQLPRVGLQPERGGRLQRGGQYHLSSINPSILTI